MISVADYHMHTPLCHHATGEPTEYAAHALSIGLEEIGMSEHSPMPSPGIGNWHMLIEDLDLYVSKVEKARRDHPDLTIRLALEVDFLPGHESWIRGLAEKHPWDYFIGSVHYISDTWDVDNPEKMSEWAKHDPYDVWTMYFERLAQAASSGLFEIIGHADLPKKFAIYPEKDCFPTIIKFLDAVSEQGIAIELNTAGLRKNCKEIYPSERLLHAAFERDIPITFASDAHAPEEVGMDFMKAIELARKTGYTKTCRFKDRKRTIVAI
ncbi:MAG TPA: histidinol-phosphatase HisJ family protein [Verrucomicrobiales bacterium]|jgi:histidinol-phosphatase (PHP family)|nr:histidinol-phosphatase HisJ family protein [Verrucomicrobiales bacterium]